MPAPASPSTGPGATDHFMTQPASGMFADDSPSAPTDQQCASIIPATPETVPDNQTPHSDDLNIGLTSAVNQTPARQVDLQRLRDLNYAWEQWNDHFWFTRITGQYTGSTEMIFRFVACKYGIDEDVVRAQATSEESNWRQWDVGGDQRIDPSLCQRADVNLFNFMCPGCCFQSWGVMQVKVFYEYMTWPIVNYSTIFGAEYRLATQRACMNGDQSPYFAGRNTTYDEDAQAYLKNPYGASSHPFNNPLTGTQATNMDWMLFSCLSSYRRGGWWDTDAQDYLGTLLSHWKTCDWLPK